MRNRADYVKSWQEFKFLTGSREALAKLTQAGHRIIVCTNQAGVARGRVSVETVEEIHCRMLAGIAEFGGAVERVYYCPHGKDEDCSCRKPRPGMLLRARDELGIDLSDAVFIGDSITDVQAGLAAGVPSILVLTGLGVEQFRSHSHEVDGPFRITLNLRHAAETRNARSPPPHGYADSTRAGLLLHPRYIQVSKFLKGTGNHQGSDNIIM